MKGGYFDIFYDGYLQGFFFTNTLSNIVYILSPKSLPKI
jgi:hypothetical protein